jgi:hypothetical protein
MENRWTPEASAELSKRLRTIDGLLWAVFSTDEFEKYRQF